MKIAKLTERRDFYELIKDCPGDRDWFVALSERGWEQFALQVSNVENAVPPRGPSYYSHLFGLPIVKVDDIADDEVEVRERVL